MGAAGRVAVSKTAIGGSIPPGRAADHPGPRSRPQGRSGPIVYWLGLRPFKAADRVRSPVGLLERTAYEGLDPEAQLIADPANHHAHHDDGDGPSRPGDVQLRGWTR